MYKFAFLTLTAVGALALALTAGAASAQDGPICTDRPTKANSVCTVPAGRWQVEADGVNWTRNKAAGLTADTTAYAATTLKYGLTERSDLQVTWTPYVEARVKGPGFDDKTTGSGDVTLRYKAKVLTKGRATVAVLPYVKVPTAADGLGNGEVEGGVAVPISFALEGFSLTFGPQVDLLLDADGDGRHAAVSNVINISRSVTPNLILIGELWSSANFDPADTVTQVSADVAAAYVVGQDFQIDVGGNFGVNGDTPDVQLYVGLSKRF